MRHVVDGYATLKEPQKNVIRPLEPMRSASLLNRFQYGSIFRAVKVQYLHIASFLLDYLKPLRIVAFTTALVQQTPPAHRQIVRVGTQYNQDTLAAGRQGEEARQRMYLPDVRIVGFTRYILFLIFSLSKRPKLLQT